MMAKTFGDMVQEARQHVQGIDSQEARQRMEANPDTFVIDVHRTPMMQALAV